MGKFTARTFIHDQMSKVPPVLTADLKGKSVMVTGANTGIGLEAVKHFAKMAPARLILACRNEQKGQHAASIVAKATGFLPEVQIFDSSRFESVLALAKRLEGEPLDILVANAGIVQPEYRVTDDGWEETLQVNHLSTALLSFLLLPNLLRGAELHESQSRLVIVSSEMHYWAMVDKLFSETNILATLNEKENFSPDDQGGRYPQSKLLNVFFTRAFAQHLSKSAPVITTTVNPGYCISEIRRNLPLSKRIGMRVMDALLGRTAEQGARQYIWAALGPDGKDGPHVKSTMNGAYVSLACTREPRDFVVSKEGYEAQERIWRETIEILSKVTPAVKTVVEEHLRSN